MHEVALRHFVARFVGQSGIRQAIQSETLSKRPTESETDLDEMGVVPSPGKLDSSAKKPRATNTAPCSVTLLRDPCLPIARSTGRAIVRAAP